MRKDEVARHYGSSGIADRILSAIVASGGDLAGLRPDMLFPYDQLHGRELQATEDHVAWLAPKPQEHVLDVGSGIGGPARFIASRTSARVAGIDLTPEFVEAARVLTERAGLDDLVTFETGDALNMPFGNASFDAAICLYVAMNIAQKEGLAREIARVLKPGGRMIWSEVVAVEGKFPTYPLPWGRSPETSSLTTADDLRQALEEAGFNDLEMRDETDIMIDHARKVREGGHTPSPEHMMANQVVMGDDFLDRRRNVLAGMETGALRSIAALARTRLDS